VGSIDLSRKSGSAHGDERNRLVVVITGGARGLRVERGLAVDEEVILVMAVGQEHLNGPPTIHLLMHRHRVPVIEIASDLHRFGTRCSAIEVDGLERIPSGIKLAGGFVIYGIHTCLFSGLVSFSLSW